MKENTKKEIYNLQKIGIMESIIWLVQRGYEVKITNSSISVVEIYKSKSRYKYIEKEIYGVFGGSQWEDGCLRLTQDRFTEWITKLMQVDEESK